MPRGGARPNAGRKKGVQEAKTLEKLAIAAAYNQKIMRAADKLFVAQTQLALGSMKVIRVDEEKDGKGNIKRVHTQVTDAQEIINLLDEHDGQPGEINGHYYFFTDILPDSRTLDSMLNRGIGKPKETVEVVNPDIASITQEVINALTQEGIPELEIRAVLNERYPEISDAVN